MAEAARGSVKLDEEETADDLRMDYYAGKSRFR
jgi:hypothetical protein